HVRRADRDAPLTLLGRAVDLAERQRLPAVQLSHHARQRGRQRGLTVVHVTDGANVDVRLRALELLFHDGSPGYAAGPMPAAKTKKPPSAGPKGAFWLSLQPVVGAASNSRHDPPVPCGAGFVPT